VPELVVVFCGTDGCKDWFHGNLTLGKFPTGRTQYDDALGFARRMRAGTNYTDWPVVFAGHSLGGGLAEYCQRRITHSLAVTFDGSPNRGFLYSLGSRKEPREVVRLFERGEILQLARWILSPLHRSACCHRSGKRARWFDFTRGNYFGKHDMGDFAMNLVKLAALAGDSRTEKVLAEVKREKAERERQRLEQVVRPARSPDSNRLLPPEKPLARTGELASLCP